MEDTSSQNATIRLSTYLWGGRLGDAYARALVRPPCCCGISQRRRPSTPTHQNASRLSVPFDDLKKTFSQFVSIKESLWKRLTWKTIRMSSGLHPGASVRKWQAQNGVFPRRFGQWYCQDVIRSNEMPYGNQSCTDLLMTKRRVWLLSFVDVDEAEVCCIWWHRSSHCRDAFSVTFLHRDLFWVSEIASLINLKWTVRVSVLQTKIICLFEYRVR